MTAGPGLNEDSIGPLIDAKAGDKSRRWWPTLVITALAVLGGARTRAGLLYPPTCSATSAGLPDAARGNLRPGARVTTFETDAEAEAAANDTEYGLVAYVYTRDLDRAHGIDELETGMMGLNPGRASNAAAPFGA